MINPIIVYTDTAGITNHVIAQVARYLHFTFAFLYSSSRYKSTCVVEAYKMINHRLVMTTSTAVLSTFYNSYLYFIATIFVPIISHLRTYGSFIHSPLKLQPVNLTIHNPPPLETTSKNTPSITSTPPGAHTHTQPLNENNRTPNYGTHNG